MNFFNLIAILVLVGLILGLMNRFLPIAGMIKTLINLVVTIVLVIYVLEFFNLIVMIMPIPQIL
jgi:hypothetical protein